MTMLKEADGLSSRVKVYFLLKRRSDITRQDFLAYWRGEHRRQVVHLKKCKLYILKVEQVSHAPSPPKEHHHRPLTLSCLTDDVFLVFTIC